MDTAIVLHILSSYRVFAIHDGYPLQFLRLLTVTRLGDLVVGKEEMI